ICWLVQQLSYTWNSLLSVGVKSERNVAQPARRPQCFEDLNQPTPVPGECQFHRVGASAASWRQLRSLVFQWYLFETQSSCWGLAGSTTLWPLSQRTSNTRCPVCNPVRVSIRNRP